MFAWVYPKSCQICLFSVIVCDCNCLLICKLTIKRHSCGRWLDINHRYEQLDQLDSCEDIQWQNKSNGVQNLNKIFKMFHCFENVCIYSHQHLLKRRVTKSLLLQKKCGALQNDLCKVHWGTSMFCALIFFLYNCQRINQKFIHFVFSGMCL